MISGGQLSTAVGGGISQFATTMFNAVFFAGLEDVYHKPHSFYISRYPAGREATVYEGVIDLEWKNDTDTGVYVRHRVGARRADRHLLGHQALRDRVGQQRAANYRQPAVQDKVDDGNCTPQSGVEGFDITVTRVFRDLKRARRSARENFNTNYAAEAVIHCVPPPAPRRPTAPPPAARPPGRTAPRRAVGPAERSPAEERSAGRPDHRSSAEGRVHTGVMSAVLPSDPRPAAGGTARRPDDEPEHVPEEPTAAVPEVTEVPDDREVPDGSEVPEGTDRTRMLAAISHDLRTPITRMRLRSEFIEDEAHRSRMLADLDQMRSMLESVLSFLRNDRRLEAMTLVDIASTLQLITDQFGDMGRKVAYDGPAHAMATVRPDDLHRSRHQSRGECRRGSARKRRSASACRRIG